MERILIGSDHAGFELKSQIIDYLRSKSIEVEDFGTNSTDSTDYPDYAHPLAEKVSKGEGTGIVICGSGNGINMTANKHRGVRSALCWLPEIAEMARLHNNANVLALPARYITTEEAKAIVDAFLGTEFEGGRHARRVNKINIE